MVDAKKYSFAFFSKKYDKSSFKVHIWKKSRETTQDCRLNTTTMPLFNSFNVDLVFKVAVLNI